MPQTVNNGHDIGVCPRFPLVWETTMLAVLSTQPVVYQEVMSHKMLKVLACLGLVS
jgi:hypothetical protein